MLDFSKLKKENNFDKIIKPEEIFMSLPNKADKYQYPRNVQAEIWSKWFECRDEKDTIIKMNTGSGKTIVGLLILEMSRQLWCSVLGIPIHNKNEPGCDVVNPIL